eukprot:2513149-Rhodomonas_salina.2
MLSPTVHSTLSPTAPSDLSHTGTPSNPPSDPSELKRNSPSDPCGIKPNTAHSWYIQAEFLVQTALLAFDFAAYLGLQSRTCLPCPRGPYRILLLLSLLHPGGQYQDIGDMWYSPGSRG